VVGHYGEMFRAAELCYVINHGYGAEVAEGCGEWLQHHRHPGDPHKISTSKRWSLLNNHWVGCAASYHIDRRRCGWAGGGGPASA
jgi:hypothetical protein